MPWPDKSLSSTPRVTHHWSASTAPPSHHQTIRHPASHQSPVPPLQPPRMNREPRSKYPPDNHRSIALRYLLNGGGRVPGRTFCIAPLNGIIRRCGSSGPVLGDIGGRPGRRRGVSAAGSRRDCGPRPIDSNVALLAAAVARRDAGFVVLERWSAAGACRIRFRWCRPWHSFSPILRDRPSCGPLIKTPCGRHWSFTTRLSGSRCRTPGEGCSSTPGTACAPSSLRRLAQWWPPPRHSGRWRRPTGGR